METSYRNGIPGSFDKRGVWREQKAAPFRRTTDVIAQLEDDRAKLVEALRGLMEQYVGDRSRENVIGPAGLAADNARSLLKSLGEE